MTTTTNTTDFEFNYTFKMISQDNDGTGEPICGICKHSASHHNINRALDNVYLMQGNHPMWKKVVSYMPTLSVGDIVILESINDAKDGDIYAVARLGFIKIHPMIYKAWKALPSSDRRSFIRSLARVENVTY